MNFAPTKPSKSPYITHLAIFPSLSFTEYRLCVPVQRELITVRKETSFPQNSGEGGVA